MSADDETEMESGDRTVFTGTEVTWVLALHTAIRLGAEEADILPLLVMIGRAWVGTNEPEHLAAALGVPTSAVDEIAKRLRAAGFWVGPLGFCQPDRQENVDGLDEAVSIVLECRVARGATSARLARVHLPTDGPDDDRALGFLVRKASDGAIRREHLKQFVRNSPKAEAITRRTLIRTLVREQHLVRVSDSSGSFWTFSEKCRREWVFQNVETGARVEPTIGECAPIRPSSPGFIRWLIETGFSDEALADIWSTDVQTILEWATSAPPANAEQEPLAASIESVRVGCGLISKDTRRNATPSLVLAIEGQTVEVVSLRGERRRIDARRLQRYTLVESLDASLYRSTATVPTVEIGTQIESADKRRHAKGVVVADEAGDVLTIRWSTGRTSKIRRDRLKRYVFPSPPSELREKPALQAVDVSKSDNAPEVAASGPNAATP